MSYLEIEKYIVTIENVHGVLNNIVPNSKIHQVIISYIGGLSAVLDFSNKEDAAKAFKKIAEHLEAK